MASYDVFREFLVSPSAQEKLDSDGFGPEIIKNLPTSASSSNNVNLAASFDFSTYGNDRPLSNCRFSYIHSSAPTVAAHLNSNNFCLQRNASISPPFSPSPDTPRYHLQTLAKDGHVNKFIPEDFSKSNDLLLSGGLLLNASLPDINELPADSEHSLIPSYDF